MANDITLQVRAQYDEARAIRDTQRLAAKMEGILNRRSATGSPLGRYTTDFQHFEKSIDAAVSRVASFGLTAGIYFTVTKSIREMLRATIDVEKSLADINVVLNLSNKNLEQFGRSLFQVAKDTGQTFKTVASAATELSRQGLGAAETQKRLKDAMILSRLAGIDAKDSVDALTAAINSFSNSVIDSTQLVAKFARVDAEFAVSSADFAEAIKRVGSTAEDAGLDVDQLIGLVTSLQQTTARGGAVIGNSLKTILTRPQRNNVVQELEALDIKVRDNNGNFLEMIDILDNVQQSFNRLGPTTKSRITELLGSLYQINQLKSLLRDLGRGDDSITSKATDLSSSTKGNEAVLRNIELNKTMAAQLNRAALNIQQAFAQIGQTGLGSGIQSALGVINTVLESFTNREADDSGQKFADGFIRGFGNFAFGPGAAGLGFIMAKVLTQVVHNLAKIAKGFGSMSEGLKGTTTELGRQSGLMDVIDAKSRKRLATEQQILSTIAAQNGMKSGSGRGSIPIGGPNLLGEQNRIRQQGIFALQSQIATRAAKINKLQNTSTLSPEEARSRFLATGHIALTPAEQDSQRKRLTQIAKLEAKQRSDALRLEEMRREDRQSALRTRLDMSQTSRMSGDKVVGAANQRTLEWRRSEQRRLSAIEGDAERRRGMERGALIAEAENLRRPAHGGFFGFGGGAARARLAELEKAGITQAGTFLNDPEKGANVRRISRLQTVGMGASFLGPIAGGIAGSMIDTSTRGGRTGRALTEGAGNIIGFAGTGAAIGAGSGVPGMAVGAVIGTAIGGIATLVDVFQQLNTILPEVTARLQAAKDELGRIQERGQEGARLAEIAEGMKSGRISTTGRAGQLNKKNFEQRTLQLLASFGAAGATKAEQQDALDAITSNNIEAITRLTDKFSAGPARQLSANTFAGAIQQFANGELKIEDLVDSLGGLNAPGGKNVLEFLGTEEGKNLLKGAKRTPRISALSSGGIGGGGAIGAQTSIDSSFINKLVDVGDPKLTKEILQTLDKNPQVLSSLVEFLRTNNISEFGPQISAFTSGIGTKKAITETNLPRFKTGRTSLREGLAGIIDREFSVDAAQQEADLLKLGTKNTIALGRSALFESPTGIERLKGDQAKTPIETGFDNEVKALRKATSTSLIRGLGPLESAINTPEGFDKSVPALNDLINLAEGIGTGRDGAIEGFLLDIQDYRKAIQSNESHFTNLTPVLDDLEKSVEDLKSKEKTLKIKKEAQIESVAELTRFNIEASSSTFKANEAINALRNSISYSDEAFKALRASGLDVVDALQKFDQSIESDDAIFSAMKTSGRFDKQTIRGFKRGMEEEDLRFGALQREGLLFSDEIASGNAESRKRQLRRGDMPALGSSLSGAFSDQLAFTTKDAYSQVLESTAEFAATLKSSFKGMFTSIIDGSQSAGEALRAFGMTIANKLLERSVNFGVDALLGGLQNLGSAALSRYHMAATGGYVTGGSGIRDDVPQMLSEGDFVLKKSSVAKYGVGKLNMLNSGGASVKLKNSYTNGALDADPNLSNFALTDENNPQNQLRFDQESGDLSAMMQYMQAKRAFENMKKQRRIGALIGIGTNLAAAGIGSLAKGVRGPGVTRGGVDAGAGYGMQYQGMAATGGLMTSRGVQRFAGGGSVDNVPALLTGGEFVMNKSAVARHGVGFMHRLNRGEVPGFNTGGFVGDAIPASSSGRGDVFNSSIEKLISSNERLRLVLEGKDKQAAPGETGSGFGSVTVNVTIHKGGEVKADVESKGSEDKKDGEEVQQGKKIGELIKNAVAETLIKESRSGGYLEQTFQRRR